MTIEIAQITQDPSVYSNRPTVRANWGGTCQGTQRTTTGMVTYITRTQKATLDRSDRGLRNAHVHLEDIVEIDGKPIVQEWDT